MTDQNGANGSSTALAIRPQVMPAVLDEEQLEILKNTFAKELTTDEFALFVQVSKRLGLSPLARQIYALKMKGTMVLHVGIDGYRALAERSQKYGGQVGPMWCDAAGQWTDVWLDKGPPAAARVGIIRKDWKDPLWAVARWESYCRDTPVWKQQPDVMLAKSAEALALRKAFPQELAGAPVYRPELDEQIEELSDTEDERRVDEDGVIHEHTPDVDAQDVARQDEEPQTDLEMPPYNELEFAGLKKRAANLVDEIDHFLPGKAPALPTSEEPAEWEQWLVENGAKWKQHKANPKNAKAAAS